ncbi:helix-turn-helix transcriptional regulator [Jonesia quinghaiensis]|uniref:helix-turn-helix transcriptional regulator n=1 Tax=Jonesia quinghaiensis TaxID=262806 RepID=UPI0004116B55|nr:helix-turn-helix domain-containing protein [Jonesia quinghaiensis]
MPASTGHFGFDGTTGRSDYGGRRTHIIQLLRDTKEPFTVADVADRVGIHVNTARFHLESLVDSGLAQRMQQPRNTPGRPRILYTGTLPNQTHERAQAFRVLADTLTVTLAASIPHASTVLYNVGKQWGEVVTDAPLPDENLSEDEITQRVLTKMDALWFAPEITDNIAQATREADATEAHTRNVGKPGKDLAHRGFMFHNCPFAEAARTAPEAVCALHAGLLNGSLRELGSQQRVDSIVPLVGHHHCAAPLTAAPTGAWEDTEGVTVDTRFVVVQHDAPSSGL